MCRVPVQLRELVKQRLVAAAEEIFELLEKTITEYEEQTEKQRTLLEQLLQPRVRLSTSAADQGAVPVEAEESPCELPHIKEERDFTKTQLCSSLKATDKPLSSPTWNTHKSPLQTQPGVSAAPESEEGNDVSVKTEGGSTWSPQQHRTQTVPLPSSGGALHTQTVPLPPPGGVLHTKTVPLAPPGKGSSHPDCPSASSRGRPATTQPD